MEKETKKKFIFGMSGYSLFLLLARAVLAGVTQSLAAFYVKGWLSSKNKEKKT